jgi:hypothetical protein
MAVLIAAGGCAEEAAFQPPRWVDGHEDLRPTLMQCVRDGDQVDVALVAKLPPDGFSGREETEFLIGLEVFLDGADGQERIFGGWMDVSAIPSVLGAHPLDERMASTSAPGTDENVARATYAIGHPFSRELPAPYAFIGDYEMVVEGDQCRGRAHVTRVVAGIETEEIVFPFEGLIDE